MKLKDDVGVVLVGFVTPLFTWISNGPAGTVLSKVIVSSLA